VNLYELEGRHNRLMEMIDEEAADTGEISTYLTAELEAAEHDIEAEFENYAKIILSKKAEIDALKNEAQRLTDRAKTIDSNVTSLKNHMKDYMAGQKIDKIKGELLTITLRKPSKRIWVDVAMVPKDSIYWIPQEPKLDKQLMKKHLTEGTHVPNATLVNGERAVLIK
jgi:hypothetical protein